MKALFGELSQKSKTLAGFTMGLLPYRKFTSIEEANTAVDAICTELGLERRMAFTSCPVVRLRGAGVKVNPRSPRAITAGYDVSIYPDTNGDQGRYLYLSLSINK